MLVGDYSKSIKLKEGESFIDLTTYSNIKLRISDNRGNLIRKYALVSEVDYTDLTLTGTEQLNYPIFREDYTGLSPKSMLTVEVLLYVPNADYKDGYLIDPWQFQIGPVKQMTAHTTSDEY